MLRKFKALLILIFFTLAMPIFAQFHSCPKEKDEEERKSYAQSEITEFSEHVIKNIRLDLRLAKHVTNRYLACLKNDKEWIENNKIDYRDNFPCEARIEGLRNRVKSTFPRMRLLLSLSMPRYTSSNPYYNGYLNPDELTEENRYQFEQFITTDIEHYFSDLAELKPLTLEEIKNSFRFLHSEEEKRTIICGEEDPNMAKSIHNTYNSPYRKACYARQYKALLFGDDELGIRGFPLIAFLNNDNPTDQELIDAMNLVLKHINVQIEKVEGDFYDQNKQFVKADFEEITPYIHYKKSIDRYLSNNLDFCDLADNAQDELDSQTWTRIGLEMGVILGGTFICSRVFKAAPFSKGLCQLPFGLGANIYFIWYETTHYNHALESILIEPDGNRNLVTLDQLDDQELAKFLSIIMLPVGTGLPELIPKLKEGIKPLKRFLGVPFLF
ncbi:MAG: hypothetical protein H6622_02660 [Halobacteriovoraceae bacterium]|nr:hypothetical protein [Halobacteriovoraceae bacterium]